MKKLFFFTLCIFLGLLAPKVYPCPAYPYPIQFKQPDGSVITIYLRGDENLKWAETTDGYSIIFNSKGYYEYAELNDEGELVCSGYIAKDQNERTQSEQKYLSGVKKQLTFSKEQVSYAKSIKQIYNNNAQPGAKAFPTTGSRKLICILMSFTDKSFTKTQTDFNNLFNQISYNADGATGSVKDFYLQNSYSKLDLSVTVVGPYTADYSMSYYGANDVYGYDQNPRALITEAVQKANTDVNYADFDNDNDGSVDGVYVIYAGYGEEAGAPANTIWAHAWSISSIVLDSKTISKYSCSSELRSNSGTGLTRIGVICHEFGHVLGAPDFYDTNYSTGGDFEGTGNWDLMAGGSWNNNGATPAHHNGYTKTILYNWATVSTLSNGATLTLLNAAQNLNSFYRYYTTTNNEYFFLENRQQVGFDVNIPGHGLIIYHVHKDISGTSINTTYPQKFYPVCASASSDPGSTPVSYGAINSGGCPYPGTSNKISFTDATIPSSKSWALANTNKPISLISENTSNKSIKVYFMGSTTKPVTPSNVAVSNITCNGGTIIWTASSGATGYYIYKNGVLDITLSTNTNTYTYNNLSSGVNYGITVSAYNNMGESAKSSTVNLLTATPPSVPTNFAIRYFDPVGYVLTWTPSTGTVSGYHIYQRSPSGGNVITTTSTSYLLGILPPNTIYIYSVAAFNNSCESNSSTIGFQSAPAAPANLIASNITSESCNLSWTAPSGSVTGYYIYRNGGYLQSTTNTSITISGLVPGTNYSFTVAAYNSNVGQSPRSNEVSVNTLSVPIPAPPTNLTANSITNSGFILSWTAPTGYVSGYRIYQDGNLKQTLTSTTASINNLNPGTTYLFTVSAYNNSGESSQSTALSVTTISITLPSVPANLVANNMISSTCILSWTASTGTVSGYRIYRNGSFLQTATSVLSAVSLITGTNTFTVSAYNDAGETAQSNSVSVNTVPSAPPSTPTSFRITYASNSSISLAWNAPNSYVSGFYVYVYGGCSSQIAKISTTNLFFSSSGFNGLFCFYVSAYNSAGESPKSNVISMTFASSMVANQEDIVLSTDEAIFNSSVGSIVLRPNPAFDKLYIDGITDFNATIFDLNGKKVLGVDNANGSIDIAKLKQGVYVIHLISKGSTIIKKIIKQ